MHADLRATRKTITGYELPAGGTTPMAGADPNVCRA
jgi:hypothetical protein